MLFVWQMDISKDEEDEEFEMCMVAMGCHLRWREKVPYAPRRLPIMTGLQWVEDKERDGRRFYSMFRMRRSVFYPLLDLLVEKYGLKSTCNMSSKEALAQFLWTLGSRQSTDNVSDRFEHSRSTINKKFHEVLECVYRMAGDYIRPKDPTFTQVHPKLRGRKFWPHFKNAIGAIDGTHIPCIVPEQDQPKYRNRKGVTSQNVMAICDFDMRFTFVVAGWPGSVHDTRVWTDARVEYDNYPHPPEGNHCTWIILHKCSILFIKLLISKTIFYHYR
jgi:hypothetical protein